MNTKYRIYYIGTDAKKVSVKEFEADSREKAYQIYSEYKNAQEDNNVYYYEVIHEYIIRHDDGTTETFESLSFIGLPKKWSEMSFKEKIEQIIENIHSYFYSKIFKINSIKYFLEDVWYWIKHYDKFTCTSHSKSEIWSIDYHILEDLVFNIDKMIIRLNDKESCIGVPDKYLLQAREQLKEQDKNYTVPEEKINCHAYTVEEHNLGHKIWSNKLEKFIHTIGIYYYLTGYGHLSDEEYAKYHMYADDKECYKSIIPVYEGTLDDIDYEKLREKTDKYWNDIMDWLKENGRDLWT